MNTARCYINRMFDLSDKMYHFEIKKEITEKLTDKDFRKTLVKKLIKKHQETPKENTN